MSREGVTPWPEHLAASYRAVGYWRGRSLGSYLWDWAERSGERTSVVDGDVRLSYLQLAQLVDGTALALREAGLTARQNIVIQLPNCWQFVVLTLACFRTGVTPVMALPAHRRREIQHLVALSMATAIVVPSCLGDFDYQQVALEVAEELNPAARVLSIGNSVAAGAESLDRFLVASKDTRSARHCLDDDAPPSDDPALFLLSGGTTGLPKLIPRTHDDYEFNARRAAELAGLADSSVYLVALPAAHNFPLACPGILGTLMTGGTVVLAPSPEPKACFALAERERVTVTSLVPAVAQRWLETVLDGHSKPSSFEVIQVGGARLAPEVARQVRPVLGCQLQQVFGMAEGLLSFTRLEDPDEVVVETQGRPMCVDDEIEIVEENGSPAGVGAMGELLTQGPYTLRGYYRAPEANATSFTADGMFRTGDVVRLHPSGNFVVEGRIKDIINRGGEKISAEEVENLIYSIEGVAQVAAVAMPDEKLGERVCLFVVPRAGFEAPTLGVVRKEMIKAGMATFKLPEHVEAVVELPLTNVGKVDKRALRERLSQME